MRNRVNWTEFWVAWSAAYILLWALLAWWPKEPGAH